MVEDGEAALLGYSLRKGAEIRQSPPAHFCEDPSSCWESESLRLSGIYNHNIWVLKHPHGAVRWLVSITEYLGLS